MKIFRKDQAYSNNHPIFNLTFYRPGLVVKNTQADDYAFGPLSRIDHAHLATGAFVKMHEHINDEILSYIDSGTMVHEDSTGKRVEISPQKLMMMNAGSSFFHEESTPKEPVEMLQIFIRPQSADLFPRVQFATEFKTLDNWRLIAGPINSGAPLEIRQDILVLDAFADEDGIWNIPSHEQYEPMFFVMKGNVIAAHDILSKGDMFTGTSDELKDLKLEKGTKLVLFLVNLSAEMTYEGNFSGHKH